MDEQEKKQANNVIQNSSHRMNIYLPNYVYQLLKTRAKQNNESMSSYIKLCLLAVEENKITDMSKKSREQRNKKEINYHNVAVQLSRIGTNLNQISRKCNSGLDIDNDLRDFVDTYSDEISDLIEKLSE